VRSKHKRILEAIFSSPARSDLRWSDIESLLSSLGAEITQRKGSRVAIILEGQVGHFHRPHPEKETDKGAVASMRTFLRKVGKELR